MIGWHRRRRRIAPLVMASILSSVTIGAASTLPSVVWAATATGPVAASAVRAQQEDQPSVTQVGEGDQADAETLDEGAPPAEPAATGNGDVETLDQGRPPAAAPVSAPGTMASGPIYEAAPAAAPATTYAAPPANTSTGPTLPPGFGSGRVHVSAGHFGFPAGLEACHVGAVTGRAYVGLDCGDGDDVVGHARSFEDFPFVPEVDFPFEGDEAFFSDSGVFANDDNGSENDVIVSAGRSSRGAADDLADDTPRNNNASNASGNSSNASDNSRKSDETTSSNDGSVSTEQRVRHREPRVRTTKAHSATSTQSASDNGKKPKKQDDNASTASQRVRHAAKGDRSPHKTAAKGQHAGKKHKAKGGKGKKHDGHRKDRSRKKR